jgi:hypothetical protein
MTLAPLTRPAHHTPTTPAERGRPATPGPATPGPATPGPAERGPAERGPAERGPAERGPEAWPGAWDDAAAGVDLRRHGWNPLLTSAVPGIATGLRCGDRLRVAVVELPALSVTAVRRTLRRTATWPVEAAADALSELDRWSSRPTLAVADLAPDGGLSLALRDAPPAIVLAPDHAARALGPQQAGAVLRPRDALLLCSASFLESPPEALSRVRDSARVGGAIDDLRRALLETGEAGAAALICREASGDHAINRHPHRVTVP